MARNRKTPMSPEQAIARGLTRKARSAPTGTRGNLSALEGAVGRRGLGERLGVSERTLRRWRAGGTPSKRHAEALAREASQAREVRRAKISPRREARLRNKGAFVRMAGKVGGGTPGARRKNTRQRTVGAAGFESVHLSGEQMADILDRWESGDDAGALDVLRDAVRETPWGSSFGNFEFDDLTMLEFLRDDPNA